MSISLPRKIDFKEIADNNYEVTIGPCYPGYGITLGNALKRVLLSSLEGGAVYAVKIKGVQHEFSTMPNVLEDVVEIILNLKQLRFKVHTDEDVKLRLEIKGKKEVTAKDIKTTSDVEIVSKDAHIATLTDKKSEIKMDIFVKKGRGYWPIEDRGGEKEIGVIAIDSFFSPIEKVGLNIKNARVEQMTNYENIILDIKIDGSLTPEEALKEATEILVQQFTFIDNSLGSKKQESKKTKKQDDDKEAESKKSKSKKVKKQDDEKEEAESKKSESKKTSPPKRDPALIKSDKVAGKKQDDDKETKKSTK
ncbi:DNA-directed RNA polymerase subunit alpha [Candidatus Falkowbacteria bacterium]|jgi:DNA-directed RNA polymerase subunit alpha|nr:DNA-directed RNA polymerase subunit alpha [Candidatus Falkowbacteria bacterium]MBT4433553.1 DNA-directed RNA polymerase subunit alpha [Candidatus Falkowbacteria bacterium]